MTKVYCEYRNCKWNDNYLCKREEIALEADKETDILNCRTFEWRGDIR